jgi:hypothetical protein
MEIFFIRSKHADVNNVFPDGFPGKGDFRRFPIRLFSLFQGKKDMSDEEISELLCQAGIVEDPKEWRTILEAISEEVIDVGNVNWTRGKLRLYSDYLVDPRSTNLKKTIKSLGERAYYPPLPGYELYTIWMDLVKFVDKNFGEYPIPYDQEIAKYCDRFKRFKERVESDGLKMSPRDYAEFLINCTPTQFLVNFIKTVYIHFPYLTDLEEMFNDGISFSWNFLDNSWFIVWSGSERVMYGEAKFEAELDHLFGETTYYKIYV